MDMESIKLGEGLDMGIKSKASTGWCNQWTEGLFTELALNRKHSICCCSTVL